MLLLYSRLHFCSSVYTRLSLKPILRLKLVQVEFLTGTKHRDHYTSTSVLATSQI